MSREICRILRTEKAKNNTAKIFIKKAVLFLKVRDIMTNPAISVTGEDTVCEAARIMQAHNIGALPVVSEKNTVDGIVTDRDIVLRTVSRGKDACEMKVKDIMTTEVEKITPDTDIKDAVKRLGTDKIRRVPVIEKNELVGMLSIGDIATQSGFNAEIAEAICEISK